MWRVDGTGLRTTLVQNCGMAAIKRTIFLHKALAGRRFPDLSINYQFTGVVEHILHIRVPYCGSQLKEGVWKI